jgi:predicted nucleic acid-binding protein
VRAAYFDASALVKLAYAEAESQALIDYVSDDDVEASTSAIADVEVQRALSRLPGTDGEDPVRGFYLIELTPKIRALAGAVGSPHLRSLDAIHLATALSIREDLEFVTYDARLAAAARGEGLRVVQPGRAV